MTSVKVTMKPFAEIVKNHGLDTNGDVQKFLTNDINNRILRYMPYRTSALIKSKFISSPTTIEVNTPYARPMYYGIDKRTGKPYNYNRKMNNQAGPKWDERLMAAEKDAIAADLNDYIKGK